MYVEGSLRTRKYTDKDGVEKYATEIRADEMKMLGSRHGAGGGNSARMTTVTAAALRRRAKVHAASGSPCRQAGSANFSDMDDDIPF